MRSHDLVAGVGRMLSSSWHVTVTISEHAFGSPGETRHPVPARRTQVRTLARCRIAARGAGRHADDRPNAMSARALPGAPRSSLCDIEPVSVCHGAASRHTAAR